MPIGTCMRNCQYSGIVLISFAVYLFFTGFLAYVVSVTCTTREPRLNSSRYRKMFCTVREGDISSFLAPVFVVVSLGDQVIKSDTPVESENLTNNPQYLENDA